MWAVPHEIIYIRNFIGVKLKGGIVMNKLILAVSIAMLLDSTVVLGSPYFRVVTQQEWENALYLSPVQIQPMSPTEWEDYMHSWKYNLMEGQSYPDTNFLPAQLSVYGGGGGGGAFDPNDAGLVMLWGDMSTPTGTYSSAWEWEYGLDPDLRNCTIQVTISPPDFGPSGKINAVSFAINDAAGLRRQWWWSVPVPIPSDPNRLIATTVTIDTSKTGVAATNPVATGYASAPGFNLANAASFDVDENFKWIFGQGAIPPPGQVNPMGMWNYWHNLSVTPHVSSPKHAKYYTKWSQPPVEMDATNPTVFLGWNEMANYYFTPLIADDWLCKDNRPITAIHWWGSFIGWDQPYPPSTMPVGFHIGIWTDVPNGADPLYQFSHPGTLIWQKFCYNWVWNFAGYDNDPRQTGDYMDACFQFNQLLSQNEWFYQDGNEPNGTVYWLSIAAIYQIPSIYPGTIPAQDPVGMPYPFGIKTRQHFYNDDAVSIEMLQGGEWPPVIGSQWANGTPIEFPTGVSWDMAFELSTNEPPDFGTPNADLNQDGFIDFSDFAIFADQWLTAGP
jgi:hypothetical protein